MNTNTARNFKRNKIDNLSICAINVIVHQISRSQTAEDPLEMHYNLIQLHQLADGAMIAIRIIRHFVCDYSKAFLQQFPKLSNVLNAFWERTLKKTRKTYL